MKDVDIFYDFLSNLKRSENTSVLEAIEEGFSVLFETASVAQSLKNKGKTNPFYAYEQKFIKKLMFNIMKDREYHFPETGDTRNPYEFLINNKFIETFLNWATWQIVDEDNDNEVILEKIEEIADKIKNIDPNQIDMFGYSEEDLRNAYKSNIEKASYAYLKKHEDEYIKKIKKLLYETPQDMISNPTESAHHSGEMAGWGDREFDEFNNNRDFEEEAVYIWTAYVWDGTNNADIAKRFKDPTYNINMATDDANCRNMDKFEEAIRKVNVEVGRESYEEVEPIIEMDNDFVWVNSGKESCSAEGRLMGHCGNEYGPDKEKGDELWSLRKGESPSDWESHITVIINGKIAAGKRVIKQIKGDGPKSGNTKPSDEYHPYIMKLLTTKLPGQDKWIVDGFRTEEYHAPGSNFQISDLSPDNKKLLYNIRPELFKNVEEMETA